VGVRPLALGMAETDMALWRAGPADTGERKPAPRSLGKRLFFLRTSRPRCVANSAQQVEPRAFPEGSLRLVGQGAPVPQLLAQEGTRRSNLVSHQAIVASGQEGHGAARTPRPDRLAKSARMPTPAPRKKSSANLRFASPSSAGRCPRSRGSRRESATGSARCRAGPPPGCVRRVRRTPTGAGPAAGSRTGRAACRPPQGSHEACARDALFEILFVTTARAQALGGDGGQSLVFQG